MKYGTNTLHVAFIFLFSVVEMVILFRLSQLYLYTVSTQQLNDVDVSPFCHLYTRHTTCINHSYVSMSIPVGLSIHRSIYLCASYCTGVGETWGFAHFFRKAFSCDWQWCSLAVCFAPEESGTLWWAFSVKQAIISSGTSEQRANRQFIWTHGWSWLL